MFMVETASRHLLVHGSIVSLVGALAGVPYWSAIVRGTDAETIRAWRIAHAFLCVEGMLILVAGLVVPRLALGDAAVRALAAAFIGSGYGFAAAFLTEALTGCRGLTPRPYGWHTLLFSAHVVGIAGALAGLILMAYGAFQALG
jgi:hypothetical protein